MCVSPHSATFVYQRIYQFWLIDMLFCGGNPVALWQKFFKLSYSFSTPWFRENLLQAEGVLFQTFVVKDDQLFNDLT